MTSITAKKDDNIGEWVNLTEDGGVRRCRTRAGTGARPKRGQKIAIHYTGKLDDGTVFATSREEGEPLDFVVGKEEIEGLTIAVTSMFCREKSDLIISPKYGYGEKGDEEKKVPPNATLHYEVELLYILEDMTKEEAIAYAEKLNAEAGDAFRKKDYELAAVLYHEAHQTLSIHLGDDVTKIIQKLRSNLSTVYGKLGKWGQSLHNAENYLRWDKDNLKCLMRKLEAYIALTRLDEADRLLAKCLRLSNNDPVFLAKKKDIEKARAEMKEVSKNAYNGLAGKKIF